ncbi:MAG: ABC transporter permease [Acidimicrobiales bacterium]
MTAPTTDQRIAAALALPDPGLAATMRSEWTKLRTAKGPIRNLILGVVTGIGLSALLALAVGATFSEWSTTDQAEFDSVLFSLSGAMLTAIFFVAVGVRTATAEYGSDMMRLTFTVTPRRARVLWAKAAVVALVTWVAGAVAMVGMILVGEAIFAAYDMQTVGLSSGETLRTMALVVLFVPGYPLLGLVTGILTRSTASAITIVLALIFAPSFFGGLFPAWWQENILSLLPGSVFDAVSIGHLTSSAMYHSMAVAVPLAIAWIVLPLLLARVTLMSRDA